MRLKTISGFSLILIFGLLICYSAFSASIFTVVGTVRNADGTLAATGLEVVINNQTRNLTVTTTVGRQEAGKYGVVFMDMENKTVAAEGDVIKVNVKNAQKILGSKTYKVTANDIAKAMAIVDVKLESSDEPDDEEDTDPPVITAVSPQGTIYTQNVTLSVTAVDASGVASVTMRLDGKEVTNVVLIGGVATAEVTALQFGEHKVEVEATDSFANTAYTEWSFVVAESGALTEMKLGGLTIRARAISQKAGNVWIASGDVSINDVLLFERDLEIDTAAVLTRGSGIIYLKHAPYLGDRIPIFIAESFAFNGDLVSLAEQAGLQTKLTVGSLAYSLDTLKLIPDGVEIGGSITLPRDTYAIIGGQRFGMVEASLSITKTRGVEFLGGRLVISKLRLGSTGFALEYLYLEYRKEGNYFDGRCAVSIPHLFSIEAAVGVKGGQLNKVGIGVDKLNKPILYTPTTPPVPIVYLQRIYGELDELSPGPPPIILRVETAITGGPQIGNNFVIRAELSVTIDTSGELIGRGDIFLISEHGRLAGAELGISVKRGLWIKGDINIINVLIASGQVALDRQNQLQGEFRGILACPQDWWIIGGRKFADVRSYFDNTCIAAAVKVSFFKVGILYDEDGFHVLMNLKEIKEIVGAAPELAAGEHIMMAPSQTAANIPPCTPFALFVLTWAKDDTDIELVSPSGKRLSRNDALAEPDKYFYQKSIERREITFAVNQPEVGNWQAVIPNVLEIGEYRLKILGGNVTPKLLLGALTIDEENLTAKITWQDKDDDDDANISLYYDTDAEGFDGALIVDNISENDELDGFQWDFSDIPSGTYYIYGKIDDGVNMPVFSYSSTPLLVQNTQAPEPPTELKGNIEGDTIKLNWKESPSGEAVEGYAFYWTDTPNQPGYSYRLAIGKQTEYTLVGLEVGRTYRIAVVAYDAQAHESKYSEPIEVSLQTTAANNPPQITSQPVVEGQVGKAYSCNVEAEDYDKDVLSYSLKVSPNGVTINLKTGVINWTPSEAQAGNNNFVVVVQDNTGGQDEQAFSVIVSDVNRNPEALIVSPSTDKPIYGEYLIRWQASDKDKDDLTVELYYSTDGGKTYIQFASGLENTEEYLWDTTTVNDGTYKLAITVRDNEASTTDYTEGIFTINNSSPWDVNNDGVVDISDLGLVGKHFGKTGKGIVGDVNEDGTVDISDLVLVGIHFGEQTELLDGK